jgi:MATE family multidrug resistance protein
MNQVNDKIESRGSAAEVLAMSWPASMGMLNRTIMQFVDGVILAHTGPEGAGLVAAQFLGTLVALIPESLATGTLTVVNTYVSQNLGAGRLKHCGRYALAGLLLALIVAACVAPLAFFNQPIMQGIHRLQDAVGGRETGGELVGMEAMYFAFMVGSIVLTLPTRVLEQFFYGINQPMRVFTASIIANVFNFAANYCLVLGKFGFPKLGLLGSGIGTVCAWGLQLAILSGMFFSRRLHERFGTRGWLSVKAREIVDLLKIGYPAGVQFVNDLLPWTIFTSILVASFGPGHLEATTVAMRYMSLSFMPVVGVGVAATALVGKYIGAGRIDLARRRAHAALLIGMAYMGLCGLAFLIFRYPLVKLFVNPAGPEAAQIIHNASLVMICAALFQMFDAMGIVYVGALRGSGDTLWPMIATTTLSWGFTVGGGWLMVRYVPQWTSVGPWITASLYVIVLGILMAVRFEGGSWQKIRLLERAEKD